MPSCWSRSWASDWSTRWAAIYYAGVAAAAVLLIYEHSLVRPDDLARVNQAFFHVNVVVSVGLLVFSVIDLIV